MSTAEQPDALARRIERLVAAGDDEPRRAELTPAVEVLRAEMAALRKELVDRLDAVAADVARPAAPLPVPQPTSREKDSELEDAVVVRLSAVLAARDDELRRTVLDSVASMQQSADRDRAAVEELSTRVAALGDRAGSPAAAAELQELREQLLDALSQLSEVAAHSASASEGARSGVQRLVGGNEDVTLAVSRLRDGLAATTADLRSFGQEQAEESESRLRGLDQQVRAELAEVRAGLDERAEQLAATLARGLTEIADEIDVAATTTRDASERVTVLAELTEVQRAEVERLVHGVHDEVRDTARALREELLERTAQHLTALGQRLERLESAFGASAAAVGERLGAVDTTVARAAGSVEQVLSGMEQVSEATDRLGGTVEAFRSEWPTRTYEVVQGARAVAEAVVLDVRGEVGARLQDVRAALEGVLGTVADARSGLDDGTERLASVGRVLVAYLEQRDRLLEAERDRVLHDVLEAFAAGLSTRERSALADRVNDVVARRRDARDAERYREAVGTPVAPTVDLPDEVVRLALSGSIAQPGQALPPAAQEDGEGPQGGAVLPGAPAVAVADPPAPDPPAAPAPPAPAPAAAPAAPAPPAVAPDPPAPAALGVLPPVLSPVAPAPQVAPEAGRASAPRPGVSRSGRGGGAVVPGPGRTSAAASGKGRSAAPAAVRGAAQPGAAPPVRGPLVRPAPGTPVRGGPSVPSGASGRSRASTDRATAGGRTAPGTAREAVSGPLPALGASSPGPSQPRTGGAASQQNRQGSGRSAPGRAAGRPSGRGRLEMMPPAPNVDIALNAAVPHEEAQGETASRPVPPLAGPSDPGPHDSAGGTDDGAGRGASGGGAAGGGDLGQGPCA